MRILAILILALSCSAADAFFHRKRASVVVGGYSSAYIQPVVGYQQAFVQPYVQPLAQGYCAQTQQYVQPQTSCQVQGVCQQNVYAQTYAQVQQFVQPVLRTGILPIVRYVQPVAAPYVQPVQVQRSYAYGATSSVYGGAAFVQRKVAVQQQVYAQPIVAVQKQRSALFVRAKPVREVRVQAVAVQPQVQRTRTVIRSRTVIR